MSALPAPALRAIFSEADLPEPPRGPRLDELLERYLRSRPAVGPRAAAQYRNAVQLAQKWLAEHGRGQSCDDLFSLDDLCDWFRWLALNRAPASVNGRIHTLWMLWRFAARRGICAQPLPDPEDKPQATEPKRDPIAFTLLESCSLLAAARRAPRMRRCPWWTSSHWTSFIGTALATSERFEALLRCPRSALHENVLLVPADSTKDRGERPVNLSGWIVAEIAALPVIAGNPLIWPYPFGASQLRRRYKLDVLIPAGLPATRKHLFHCLRKTGITQVAIARGPEEAQKTARHAGINLTWRNYISQTVMKREAGAVVFDVPPPS